MDIENVDLVGFIILVLDRLHDAVGDMDDPGTFGALPILERK